MSLSVRILSNVPFGDIDEDSTHSDFFFNNGYFATAYHNEEHMITEYYKSPIDIELFQEGNREDLYEMLSYTPMVNKDWPDKQVVDEEIVTDILDYYAEGELVKVEEVYDDIYE